MAQAAEQTRYRVEGMDCAGCASKIDKAARRMSGVEDVSVSVSAGTMILHHTADEDLPALERTITGLGYTVASFKGAHAAPDHEHAPSHGHAGEAVEGLHGHDHGPTQGPWWKSRKGQLTIASGLALVVAYVIGRTIPVSGHWPFVAAMLVGLVPIGVAPSWRPLPGRPFPSRC